MSPAYALSDEQRMVVNMVHQFAEREMRPAAPHHDETETMAWEVMKKFFDLGYKDMIIGGNPRDRKSRDPDAPRAPADPGSIQSGITAAAVVEELCWGCAGMAVAMMVTGVASSTVGALGNPEQRQLWYDWLKGDDADGRPKVGAYCLTEPGAGSDIAGLSTSATRDGDHYVINGTKQWISNGISASAVTVWTTIDKSLGRAGFRCFMVPKGHPGFRPGKKESKLGLRASETAAVIFEDCRVPADWLLQKAEQEGIGGAKRALAGSRPLVGAMALGIARAAFEYALEWTKERVAFGGPVASKQAVAFQFAEMATKIDAARLLCHRAAALADRGEPSGKEGSMAKWYAAEVAMETTELCLQLMGGYGYSKEYPVEKWHRDARIFNIFEGTGMIQRRIIAKELIGVVND